MPRAVYSTRFIGLAGTGSSSSSYTVPTGYVAVIRDITIVTSGDAGADVDVSLLEPNVTYRFFAATGTGPEADQWQGRQVVNAGETIEATTTTSSYASCAVSGYLLLA